MPMRPFGFWFPDLAGPETRCAVVPEGNPHLRAGSYGFVELYCDEPGCPCDNVMINVHDDEVKHLATINQFITPGGGAWAEAPDTFLDPLNQQSEHSDILLDLFLEVILTPEYRARLRRHREMVRVKVDAGLPRGRRGGKGKGRSRNPARGWFLRPETRMARGGAVPPR